MITIKNFEIQDNNSKLAIDIQTEIGSTITSVLLWNMNDFKDYTKAINLNYKLSQLDNNETFIVTNTELTISEFTDIWFIEIQSDYIPENNCDRYISPALGLTYNLSPYYKCMLSQFFENKNPCLTCETQYVDNLVLSMGLTIDIIEKSIEEGFYIEAIELIKKLKKFCNVRKCNNCENITCQSCSKFKQT